MSERFKDKKIAFRAPVWWLVLEINTWTMGASFCLHNIIHTKKWGLAKITIPQSA